MPIESSASPVRSGGVDASSERDGYDDQDHARCDTNVLLFDEPTAGIDVGGEETIHTLLQRTQRERRLALILVTHDLSIVYGYATNVLRLNNLTSCYGPPKQILDPKVLQSIYGSEGKFYQHAHD
jgi:zinc transport system ATP-binding protein